MNYDYAIVGGGPVGSLSAKNILEKGYSVAVIEEHNTQPVHCAGLISKSGLEKLGLHSNGPYTLNRIRGARLYSRYGTMVEVKPRDYKAVVVDRSLFDQHLLNSVVESGARLINDRVKDAGKNKLRTRDKRPVDYSNLVLATGVDYNLHRTLGLQTPTEFLVGAQYEMKVDCDPEFVELHFIVPDFFAWIIPLEDRARVGLCVKSNPIPYLNYFVKILKAKNRIKSDKVLDKSCGTIPIHNPKIPTQYGSIKLVGDAAGQVKASTGGGIVMGGLAAKHITAEDYDRTWRREIGRELWMHLMVHRFMARLTDWNINRLFKLLQHYTSNLEDGDMDYASKTFKSLFRNPVFALRFLHKMPGFMLDLL